MSLSLTDLQAALESMLSELGMDTAGNKVALVERLVAASEETFDQAPMAATVQASCTASPACICTLKDACPAEGETQIAF